MKIGNKAHLEAAIAALGARETIQPHEFTKNDFADELGISQSAAESRLKKAVASGVLVTRKLIVNGKRTNAYSMKPTESKSGKAKKAGLPTRGL